MLFRDYYHYLKAEGLLQGYIRNNVKSDGKKLDTKKRYKVSSEEILVVKKGVLLVKKEKEDITLYDLSERATFITTIEDEAITEIMALEETYLEVYEAEDLLTFIEKEQLGSVFWLKILKQQQAPSYLTALNGKERIKRIIEMLARHFGKVEESGVVQLPGWVSPKLISKLSYTNMASTRNVLASEGIMKKKNNCWEVLPHIHEIG